MTMLSEQEIKHKAEIDEACVKVLDQCLDFMEAWEQRIERDVQNVYHREKDRFRHLRNLYAESANAFREVLNEPDESEK